MKLHLAAQGPLNTFAGYGDGYVLLNQDRRYERGLVVLPERVIEEWGSSGFAALTAHDFAALMETGAEIVLLGTGSRQRFPPPHLLRPLIEARIGVEIMDLQAACRTYNILLAEGRKVAAALLFD